MGRTTHHASWLIAALVAWTGIQVNAARAADPSPRKPASIAAKSTQATAGTGRRPLRERIAASNLPLRVIPKPVDAIPGQDPDRAGGEPNPQSADGASIAAQPSLLGVVPVSAEPPAADEADVTEISETTTENVGLSQGTEVAEAADIAAGTGVAAATAVVDATAVTEVNDVAEVTATRPAVPHPEPAVPLPTQPRPLDPVRESLMDRVKDAFAAPPRANADGLLPRTPAAAAPQALVPPARLEFDVRESRTLVAEGEQIVMRIAVRNVGGSTAEQVTTKLYFADGIEPVQAIGDSAKVYPGEVRFATVPELSPGSSIDLLVTAVGTRPGSVAYRAELACSQLAGPVAREGAVTVQPRRTPAP